MGQNPYLKFTAALRGGYADIENETLQNAISAPQNQTLPKSNTWLTSKLQTTFLPALMEKNGRRNGNVAG